MFHHVPEAALVHDQALAGGVPVQPDDLHGLAVVCATRAHGGDVSATRLKTVTPFWGRSCGLLETRRGEKRREETGEERRGEGRRGAHWRLEQINARRHSRVSGDANARAQRRRRPTTDERDPAGRAAARTGAVRGVHNPRCSGPSCRRTVHVCCIDCDGHAQEPYGVSTT